MDTLTVSIHGLDPAFSMAPTRRRLGVSAESTPSAEGLLSATFAARYDIVHTGERAPSSSHPIGRCGEVLVSGIEGQPSATRIRAQRPRRDILLRAAYAANSSTVSAGSARRRLDSTGPGRADLLTVSSTVLTWIVSAQIVRH